MWGENKYPAHHCQNAENCNIYDLVSGWKQLQMPLYEIPLPSSALIPPERLYLGATSHSNIHWLSVWVSEEGPSEASNNRNSRGIRHPASYLQKALQLKQRWVTRTAALSGSDSRRCGCCISVWYAVCFMCACTVTLPCITLTWASAVDLHLLCAWTVHENLWQCLSASDRKGFVFYSCLSCCSISLLLNSHHLWVLVKQKKEVFFIVRQGITPTTTMLSWTYLLYRAAAMDYFSHRLFYQSLWQLIE